MAHCAIAGGQPFHGMRVVAPTRAGRGWVEVTFSATRVLRKPARKEPERGHRASSSCASSSSLGDMRVEPAGPIVIVGTATRWA